MVFNLIVFTLIIRQHPNAGNCYHASWPGKWFDKCSSEGTERECEDNDDGVWCD